MRRRALHVSTSPAARAARLATLWGLAGLLLAPPTLRAQSVAADDSTPVVVVTATRHRLLAVDAPASLSVVSRADIEQRGADDVLEAVRLEPGLSLQGRAVGGRKVLGLRGLDARHTLFLLDGQRTSASDGVVGASDFQYDWLATSDIERIEVVRGPLSVLYGSEALGGVVNVITREPGERWRLAALAEGSQAQGDRGGDGWRATASADGPLGAGWTLRAGAAESRVTPLQAPGEPRLSELEGRDKRSAWWGLGWRGGSHRLRLDGRDGTELREAGARERSGARRWHTSFNDIERRTLSFGWQADWPSAGGEGDTGIDAAEPLQTDLRAYRAELDVANRRTAGVPVNATQVLTDDVVDGQMRLARAPGSRHGMLLGFEWRDEQLADNALPGGRSAVRHQALFVQDEWRPALGRAALTVTAGLRHDDHGTFGAHWSPRLYAVWRLGDGFTVKGGASHGFKAPNLKQVAPGARAEGPNTVIGNPALAPEVADAAELGLAWEQGRRQWQLTAFDQRVRDLIELRLVSAGPAPGTGTYDYENLAEARLRGAELMGVERLAPWLTAHLAVTGLDARDGSGRRLERRPRWNASLRLEAEFGRWRAGWAAEHSGEQLLPATTVGAPPQPVQGVTLQSAHAAVMLGHGLVLQAGVRNLGNVRLADRSPLFTQVEMPRTWRLALRGRW